MVVPLGVAVGGDGRWWIGVRCEVVVVMALFVQLCKQGRCVLSQKLKTELLGLVLAVLLEKVMAVDGRRLCVWVHTRYQRKWGAVFGHTSWGSRFQVKSLKPTL